MHPFNRWKSAASRLFIIIGFCLAALTKPIYAVDPVIDGDVCIFLEGGLWAGSKAGEISRRNIELDFVCNNNHWESEVWGYANFYDKFGNYASTYNKMDHQGQLMNSRQTADGIRLSVRMTIEPDQWGSKGGTAEYAIVLKRKNDTLTGNFTGKFNEREAHGTATGTIKPHWPTSVSGWKRLGKSEHPRLVFRRRDIPALRKKSKTPEGAAIIRQLEKSLAGHLNPENAGFHAAGHGFLYILTGDKKEANIARDLVEKIIANKVPGGENFWGSNYKLIIRTPPAVGVALAYDMCYDAWEQEFRLKVADELERKALEIILGVGKGTNEHPHSNWQGILRGGAGVAALSVLGDKVAFPPRPKKPTEARVIEAPEDFHPKAGVPIVGFTDNLMPKEWLMAGPLTADGGEEPLASIGGPEKGRPQPGTKVTAGGTTSEFTLLEDPQMVTGKYFGTPPIAFDLYGFRKRYKDFEDKPAYLSFYTVLKNDKARLASIRFAQEGEVAMWVGGERLLEGDFIKLDTGYLPIMLKVNLHKGLYAAARLDETTVSEYDEKLAQWQRAYKEYTARGGIAGTAARSVKICERSIKRYLKLAIGDHGYCIEGDDYQRYAAVHGVLPFLRAYRNVTGKDLVSGPNAEWLMPLWVMRIMIDDVTPVIPVYGTGSEQWSRDFYRSGDWAMGVSATGDKYKPAVYWMYTKFFGLFGDKSFDITLPHHAIYALSNTLSNIRDLNPADVLPRAVVDKQRGFAVFRNRWKDKNDCIASIYFKSQLLRGCWAQPDSCSFRIFGLGGKWAVQGGSNKVGDRGDENVVIVPDTSDWMGAKVIHSQVEEDGSGVISADLRELLMVYQPKDKAGPEGAKFIHKGSKVSFYDAGYRGIRSFACDYSGACGVPGMFVVVDKITADKSKVWTMHTSEKKVSVEGNTFTIYGPEGATMLGTFVAPDGVSVSAEDNTIKATGGDEFFVIMTVQKGMTPEVKIEGAWLDSKVTVGKQKIRFDGEKIVLNK